MLYIDKKYAAMLSTKLLMFKQIDRDRWNFRCPFCGDSKKNKFKARGYIYNVEGALNFKCWNCSKSCSLGTLIKSLDETLYKEYVFERFKEGADSKYQYHNKPIFLKEETPSNKADVLAGLTCVKDLPSDHFAVKYLNGRLIPEDKLGKIYFVDKFLTWVNDVKPGTFPTVINDHPRIVFPYFDKEGHIYSTNSRAFDPKIKQKYMIIKIDENCENIYGLDEIDLSKKFYVLEGNIDQMFLPNCLAVSGTNFDVETIRKNKKNAIFVMDNEPRNPEATKILYGHITKGYNVCLWPDTCKFKDINEAIVDHGYTQEELVNIIEANTYQGLAAKVKFTQWKKCNI